MANFTVKVMVKLRDDLEFFRQKRGRFQEMLGNTKVHCILDVAERSCGMVILRGDGTRNADSKLRRVLTYLSSVIGEQSL